MRNDIRPDERILHSYCSERSRFDLGWFEIVLWLIGEDLIG